MPIEFPLPTRGNPFDRVQWVKAGVRPPQQQPAPNLTRPNFPFSSSTLAGSYGWQGNRIPVNVRRLGKFYENGGGRADANPAAGLRDMSRVPDGTVRRIYRRMLSDARFQLSGVTKDCAGTPVPGVRVMLFRTGDNAFIAETVSDGAGAWVIDVTGGPFFTVDYLVGSPDRAGTSANTLTAVRV